MKTHRHVVQPLLFCLSCLLFGSIAAADGQDSATAEALYSDALSLMERGDYVNACPKLEESHRLDPAVGTLLYLGECYDKAGKTASAWTTFMSAAEAAERAKQTDREQMARERVRELSARVPKLVINVAPAARLEGLEVRRDGTTIREPLWGNPTAADPGQHVITATAPNRQSWQLVVTLPATAQPIVVDVPLLAVSDSAAAPLPVAPSNSPATPAAVAQPTTLVQPAAVPPSAAAPASRQEPSVGPNRIWPTVGWVATGAGVVGLAVGVGFGLDATSKEKKSEDYCFPSDKSRCNAEGVSLLDKAQQSATIATVGFIAGGVALAGGAAILLFAPRDSDSPKHQASVQLTPSIGPSDAGLFLNGCF